MIENNGVKKREWVKNAIIIFLVVMLALTFFSNTIMNYSLPEVAAQYSKSGSISEQIRGSGTIEASEVYEVKINESRIISSVGVKVGDKVEKGQVLMSLEDTESDELIKAQDELDKLNIEYQKALLSTGKDYSLDYLAIKNFEEDIADAKNDLANIAVYQREHDKAKNTVREKQNAVNALKKEADYIEDQLKIISGKDYTFLNEDHYKLIEAADQRIKIAEKNKTKADDKVTEIENKIKSSGTGSSDFTAMRRQIEEKENEINSLYVTYFAILGGDIEGDVTSAWNKIVNAETGLKYLREDYGSALTKEAQSSAYDTQLQTALSSQKKAIESVDKANADLTKIKSDISKTLKTSSNKINDKLEKANEALKTAEEEETLAKEKAKLTVEEAEDNINKLERDLEDKKATLAQDQRKDAETAGVTALDLKSKQDEIKKLEENIAKLKEKTTGAVIKAQVGGIISSLNCTAGGKTNPENALAVIEMTDLGYSLSFTVTNEQAKKLKAGDIAEIQYFWYGNAEAKIQSIKPDKTDPTRYKIITLSVTGDVSPGQSLQVVLGGKGQNYEIVLPNSAIREDNNGKFILAVIAKSSPLGNRFIAERIDVEVLATDGINSAVSGALYGSEFVITTSTKPIESGMQVRMASN